MWSMINSFLVSDLISPFQIINTVDRARLAYCATHGAFSCYGKPLSPSVTSTLYGTPCICRTAPRTASTSRHQEDHRYWATGRTSWNASSTPRRRQVRGARSGDLGYPPARSTSSFVDDPPLEPFAPRMCIDKSRDSRCDTTVPSSSTSAAKSSPTSTRDRPRLLRQRAHRLGQDLPSKTLLARALRSPSRARASPGCASRATAQGSRVPRSRSTPLTPGVSRGFSATRRALSTSRSSSCCATI